MRRQITGTRREILTWLQREGPQTVQELSVRMGITPVGVRKQLELLEVDGLVQAVPERRLVGRPAHVYSLMEAAADAFPQAYERMLAAVLRQVRSVGGDALLGQVLDARRREMEEACRERCAGAATLEERVRAIAEVREEAGYMVEWAREGDAYVYQEHNCPLCRTSREFPILCEGDLALFRNLLGDLAEVERTEHRGAGQRRCAYVIRPL